MIFGIGTDICDIRRMEATWQRQGERFARKVLSDAEFLVWQKRSARWPQRGLRGRIIQPCPLKAARLPCRGVS